MLDNKSPIIVTWIPRKLGASLPDGKNSALNYLDILLNHKLKNKEDRDIYLVVNGPGFELGQIEELENQLKKSKVDGIHIVDLYQYDWSAIDQGWKLDGKPISIKEYYKDMYDMAEEERTYFAIEVDTFRLLALALLGQFTKQKGGIYIDFDSLSAIDGHIGKNITIPEGILLGWIGVSFYNQAGTLLEADTEKLEFLKALNHNYKHKVVNYCKGNDLIAINDPTTAVNILFKYKNELLSQSQMCSEIKIRLSSLIDKKEDELTTEQKEGIKEFISNINNNGIKALYDISNFKFIIQDGVDMNLGQRSIFSMVKTNDVGQCMRFSFRCNNGNYNEGKSDQSWMKEDLHSEAIVNAQDDDSNTPLILAAKNGDMEAVKLLIDGGAEVDEKNKNNSTPLHFAAQNGRVDVVKFLIDKGANISLKSNVNNGYTALHFAAFEGHKEVVEYLLNNGACVDAQSKNDFQPIHSAALSGNIDLMGYLIGKGADVNAKDKNGFQPIHSAAQKGHIKAVEYLLNNGARVDAQSKNGFQPIHSAAFSGNIDLMGYLIGKGANINAQDNNGLQPIHVAAENGHIKAVEYLLNNGACVDAQSKNDFQPIHSAALSGNIDLMGYLIGKGADVNAKDKNGFQPIHLAAQEGHIKAVEYLLNNGARVDAQSKNGLQPIHSAAFSGNIDLMGYLIGKGADVNAKDENGF